jgi:hypothetical protein
MQSPSSSSSGFSRCCCGFSRPLIPTARPSGPIRRSGSREVLRRKVRPPVRRLNRLATDGRRTGERRAVGHRRHSGVSLYPHLASGSVRFVDWHFRRRAPHMAGHGDASGLVRRATKAQQSRTTEPLRNQNVPRYFSVHRRNPPGRSAFSMAVRNLQEMPDQRNWKR